MRKVVVIGLLLVFLCLAIAETSRAGDWVVWAETKTITVHMEKVKFGDKWVDIERPEFSPTEWSIRQSAPSQKHCQSACSFQAQMCYEANLSLCERDLKGKFKKCSVERRGNFVTIIWEYPDWGQPDNLYKGDIVDHTYYIQCFPVGIDPRTK